HLKRDAQLTAVPPESRAQRLRRPRQNGPAHAGALKQRRRLQGDHFPVGVHAALLPDRYLRFQDLPSAEPYPGRRHHLQRRCDTFRADTGVPAASQAAEKLKDQRVAGHDGAVNTEPAVDSRLTMAYVVAVDDVVMSQAGGVPALRADGCRENVL